VPSPARKRGRGEETTPVNGSGGRTTPTTTTTPSIEESSRYASMYPANGVNDAPVLPRSNDIIAPYSAISLYIQQPRLSAMQSLAPLSKQPSSRQLLLTTASASSSTNKNDDDNNDNKDNDEPIIPIVNRPARWEVERVMATLTSGEVGPTTWSLNQLLFFSYQTRTLPTPPVSASSIMPPASSPSSSASTSTSTSIVMGTIAPLHAKPVIAFSVPKAKRVPITRGRRGAATSSKRSDNKDNDNDDKATRPIFGGIEPSTEKDDVHHYLHETKPIVSTAIPHLLDSLLDLLKCGLCNNHYLDRPHPKPPSSVPTLSASTGPSTSKKKSINSSHDSRGSDGKSDHVRQQLEQIESEAIEREWPNTSIAVLSILLNLTLHPLNVIHVVDHRR
jgi:hypothetical protein